MDLNLIQHPSPANKMKCSFLDYVHFWWSAGLVDELEPHLPLLSCLKNEMLIFRLHSTSDDQPGWLMDSKPICHPSPANKMKCSYFDYVQLLMIGQGGWWTQTPSTTPLHPEKWNPHFCITFNFWCWPDWSMDSNPIHCPSAAKKMKCYFFVLHSTSDDWTGWVMDSNPIHHPSQAKKMKCSFLDYIQLMISQAGQGTPTHLSPLSSQ